VYYRIHDLFIVVWAFLDFNMNMIILYGQSMKKVISSMYYFVRAEIHYIEENEKGKNK